MKLSRIHSLQGNLTLSYTYITAIALLIVELIGLVSFQQLAPTRVFQAEPDVDTLQPIIETAASYLDQEPADIEGLQSWLNDLSKPVLNLSDADDWLAASYVRFPQRDRQTVLVATVEAGVLAVTPSDSELANVTDIRQLPGRFDQEMFAQAPQQSGGNAVMFRHDDASVMVLPITDDDENLLGLFVIITDLSRKPPSTLGIFLVIGGSIVAFTGLAALVGTIFGYFTANRLTQRIYDLIKTTSAWGNGDFTTRIAEGGDDEIGQLALHLNQLATQLEDLLAAREQWAATETRHHLARELHDSVKQQVFAVRMHLASAQILLATSPEQAQHHIDHAEALTQQSQQELSDVINVLRSQPAASDIVLELTRLLDEWMVQSNIAVERVLDSPIQLQLSAKHEVLRILQEALANTLKHSHATKVFVAASIIAPERCQIVVSDNGTGFDLQQQHTGFGIQSMRERVARIGGVFSIESSTAGTKIMMKIPTITEGKMD